MKKKLNKIIETYFLKGNVLNGTNELVKLINKSIKF